MKIILPYNDDLFLLDGRTYPRVYRSVIRFETIRLLNTSNDENEEVDIVLGGPEHFTVNGVSYPDNQAGLIAAANALDEIVFTVGAAGAAVLPPGASTAANQTLLLNSILALKDGEFLTYCDPNDNNRKVVLTADVTDPANPIFYYKYLDDNSNYAGDVNLLGNCEIPSPVTLNTTETICILNKLGNKSNGTLLRFSDGSIEYWQNGSLLSNIPVFTNGACCCDKKTSYKVNFVSNTNGTETFTIPEIANNVDVHISRANTIQGIGYLFTGYTDQVEVNNLLIGDVVVIRLYI